MSEYGIDVSSNNGVIDWPTVSKYLHGKCANPFAFVKVSEGIHYVNPQWYRDRMGAHAAGLEVGLYHYARPSKNTGHDEAAYFLKVIGDAGGILKGEALALDLEDTDVAPNADLLAYANDFLGTIERALGIKPFFYSGEWYIEPHNLLSVRQPWWIARYGAFSPINAVVWQYSASGSVPGVQGDVDLDQLNGDISTWRQFAWGWQPDPLHGQPIDVAPDVTVDPKSESTIDAGTVAAKIAEDAAALAGALTDAVQKRLALTIKADADLIRKITWGH